MSLPLGIDPYLTSVGGTQAAYYISPATNTLTQIGGTLPTGENVSAGATRAENFSSNCIVQIGDIIYAWVNNRILKYDLNNPTDDWTIIHTLTTPILIYLKSGFFSAMLDGEPYLIGAYPGGSSNTIRGFKLKLSDESLTESATTSITISNSSFRSPVQHRGKLFFTVSNSSTNSPAAYYDPKTNLVRPTRIDSSSFSEHWNLVSTEGKLYLIGRSSASNVGLYEYNDSTESFIKLRDLGIEITSGAGRSFVAFPNRSSWDNFIAGDEQAIWYVSYGPAPVTNDWRLHEIYYDNNTEQWEILDWGAYPIGTDGGWNVYTSLDDQVSLDANVRLFYSDNRNFGDTIHVVFFPGNDVLSPFMDTGSSTPATYGQLNLPYSIHGGEECTYRFTDTAAYMIITSIDRIPNYGYTISFTLWDDNGLEYDVAFLYSLKQGLPKLIFDLENASHGTISPVGGGGDYILNLTADDGATTYIVDIQVDSIIEDNTFIRIVPWIIGS